MSLIGKSQGKITFVCEVPVPQDDVRRFKYKGKWVKIRCQCGVEKSIPMAGAAGYKSCGCAQYDRLKTIALETSHHFPNRVTMSSVKEKVYVDL